MIAAPLEEARRASAPHAGCSRFNYEGRFDRSISRHPTTGPLGTVQQCPDLSNSAWSQPDPPVSQADGAALPSLLFCRSPQCSVLTRCNSDSMVERRLRTADEERSMASVYPASSTIRLRSFSAIRPWPPLSGGGRYRDRRPYGRRLGRALRARPIGTIDVRRFSP
jgi:hypothetical protein